MLVRAVKVSDIPARPMALLARILSGPKILDWSFDRPILSVRNYANELLHPVQLGLHISSCAMPHMALHAINLRVRRMLIGHEFRLHRCVASLSAKLDRFGIAVGLIAADGSEHQKEDRTDHHDAKDFSVPSPG